jgi:hypothetical protein
MPNERRFSRTGGISTLYEDRKINPRTDSREIPGAGNEEVVG